MSVPLHQGAVLYTVLLAGTLTFILGTVSVALYRRAVDRAMRASAAPGTPSLPDGRPERSAKPPVPLPPLRLHSISATDDKGKPELAGTFVILRRRIRRASLVYVLAGLAHASVATVLLLSFSGIAFGPARTSIVIWAKAWPVVLTLWLLWGPDRRRQGGAALVYVLIGLALGLWQQALGTPAFPLSLNGTGAGDHDTLVMLPSLFLPLFLWAIYALPTLFLLVFLNRRVRAVGPLLLAFCTIAAVGTHAGVVLLGTDTGLALTVALARAARIPSEAMFYLVQFVGFIIFAVPAYLVSRRIGRMYEQKRISDQGVVFDAVWLVMTLLLVSALVREQDAWGWVGLLAFVAYKLVAHLGLRPREAQEAPARLLLLRVFGLSRQAQRLFDLLSANWRYVGPINLISATDLATRLIEPSDFLSFASGQLRRRFVRTPDDLDRRLERLDLRPDPDGRFRVNQFFCTTDTWKAAVVRLMAESDLVAMDLRGFAPSNKGCIYELQSLLDTVALDRIVLLIDSTTDESFLRQILGSAWQRMAADSPNADGDRTELRLLRTGKDDVAAVRTLLRLDPAGGRTGYQHQSACARLTESGR